MITIRTTVVATLISLMTGSVGAQWLKHPTPGIPRTPDGKPDLKATAPKTADGRPELSGLWRLDAAGYGVDVTADLKREEVQPWAETLYKQRMEDLGKDGPGVRCLPFGPGYSLGGGLLLKIIQTPTLIVFLNEDLTYRQVFLDGRDLPKDPNPAWMGYSVGHWEGETLVVETAGYNDRSWLDFGGHPHTEELRVTERFRRRDFGHMDLEVTFADPKVYARPWTIKVDVEAVPDTELLEYVCAENEKDRSHLVGKASDDKKNAVKLPRELLSRYVGTYEFRPPEDPSVVIPINFTLAGDELLMDQAGRGAKFPLTPLSETIFNSPGGRVEFVADDRGTVAHVLFRAVEGDFKAVRKK